MKKKTTSTGQVQNNDNMDSDGTTTESRPYRVFISYAHVDEFFAVTFRSEIEQEGIDVFLDEEVIETGQNIEQLLREEINEMNEFILVHTENSRQRQWVNLELGAAWILGKRITAILCPPQGPADKDWGMPWLGNLKQCVVNDFRRVFLRDLKKRAENYPKRCLTTNRESK